MICINFIWCADLDNGATNHTAMPAFNAHHSPHPFPIAPRRRTVLQLAAGALSGGDALQEALKITRLLLDFRLPEGIKSRQILQQMQSFQTA